MTETTPAGSDGIDKEELRKQLDDALNAGVGPKAARFAMAALGGLVPIVGGAIGAAASTWSEQENEQFQKILRSWLKLQEDEIKEIGMTLVEVMSRLDQTDEKVRKRIESQEYLSIIKKCFRDWSAAESEEKRRLIRNLLINAAAPGVAPDDLIRLFIEWIDHYSEFHFKVVRAIYNRNGITRAQIWDQIHGERVAENSAEADLFKLAVHDLSVGHIIRQHRPVDRYGNFIKATPTRSGGSSSGAYTSAFDGEKPYELTELGQRFVHYTMQEIVQKIGHDHSG